MMKLLGLDAVNVSFLPSDNGGRLPLVVSPRWDSSLSFLCTWLEHNRPFLDEMMLKHGAVLIRGFEVSSSVEFEQAILSFKPGSLSDCYRGTSPRKLEQGCTYIFSAADVPARFPIAQHLEMSFLPAPPRALFFSCMKAPTSAGGETALCDFRKVYQSLSPELRQKFFDKKIRYERTHRKNPTASLFNFDVADMKGWPELFGTSDKDEVERICKEEGVNVRWEGPNNDIFVSTIESEAFQHHPVTHEPVWFNHSQVFHWTTFPMELWLAFRRTYDVRLLFHCLFVTIVSIIKYGILGKKMGLNASFGDGTPITALEMHEIRSAVHKHMVYSRWELGDIICIDNFAVSHGRQPTYDYNRKVVVAWSHALTKANTLTSVEDENVATQVAVDANPQERTPESTLTAEDAKTLKMDLVNAKELEEALARKTTCPSDSFTYHKRAHSQPVMQLHPSSDFWKECSD